MEVNYKIVIIAILTIGVIVGGILIYFFVLKSNKDNMCQKINKKYNLKNDEEYVYQPNGRPSIPLCCPKECGELGCGYTSGLKNNCMWEIEKDDLNNEKLTLPEYECEEILKDEKLKNNVCYIKS
tara:strand:- start:52 stop:426 length:375 start_codon:yes stop_codon:yes gene_type:complete